MVIDQVLREGRERPAKGFQAGYAYCVGTGFGRDAFQFTASIHGHSSVT
jgi:hypothetical protein